MKKIIITLLMVSMVLGGLFTCNSADAKKVKTVYEGPVINKKDMTDTWYGLYKVKFKGKTMKVTGYMRKYSYKSYMKMNEGKKVFLKNKKLKFSSKCEFWCWGGEIDEKSTFKDFKNNALSYGSLSMSLYVNKSGKVVKAGFCS